MMKIMNISFVALTVLLLAGCQTSNAIKNASSDGMANMFT
jgi:outer membrane murein-binding lipoprotein Lpp